MKKFMAPLIRIVEIENVDILTESVGVVNVGGGGPSKSRGLSDFDDDF